jgi:hypothetical protein
MCGWWRLGAGRRLGQDFRRHIAYCVCQGVTTEVAITPKHLATGTTLVGLVVGVGEQVGLEVGALVETAAAHRTLVGGLLHVQDLVHGQSPRLAEPLATLSALERLLLRVDVPVVPEVVLAPKRLPADVTRVRSLVRVRALVDQQVVRLGELSAAELAYELLLGA